MCTDLRLVKLDSIHVSARTMDFAQELGSRLQVVPVGQHRRATATGTSVEALSWTNTLGYVALDAYGFDWVACDGLNAAGLSIGTLWLPETDLPTTPPQDGQLPAIDLINFGAWLLGTCSTVKDVRDAFGRVQIWNARAGLLWPTGQPMPAWADALKDFAFPMHLAIHDAHGGDLVIEFLDGSPVFHDNPIGVCTNSPTLDWHLTNLRNYVELSNIESKPVDLMGIEMKPTGNGTGLLGMPGDVTPPSRFVRATVLSEVATSAKDSRDAVNQAFHSLELCSVPRHVAASGDYTQWSVARDHDNLVYYVRTYDAWTTDAHDLKALGVMDAATPRTARPLPSA